MARCADLEVVPFAKGHNPKLIVFFVSLRHLVLRIRSLCTRQACVRRGDVPRRVVLAYTDGPARRVGGWRPCSQLLAPPCVHTEHTTSDDSPIIPDKCAETRHPDRKIHAPENPKRAQKLARKSAREPQLACQQGMGPGLGWTPGEPSRHMCRSTNDGASAWGRCVGHCMHS